MLRRLAMSSHDHVAAVLKGLIEWAKDQEGILGVLLVGSYARGAQRPDSDVDLVLLVDHKEQFIADFRWLKIFGSVGTITREEWGVSTSLRIDLASGLQLELGWVAPSWADTCPLDPGTERVVSDGAKILYDPQGRLAQLLQVVAPGSVNRT